jgi:catechol 2,3-dioxygenase-like lactoylglutathione lyase family enzyme
MVQFRSAAPTFVVSDVGSTAAWYESQLGFRAGFFPETEPYVYASLGRDGVEIMLLRIEGYQKPDSSHLRPAGLWDAYIRMMGVREFYEDVRKRIPVKMELTRQRYGDLEFEVRDPNDTCSSSVSCWSDPVHQLRGSSKVSGVSSGQRYVV